MTSVRETGIISSRSKLCSLQDKKYNRFAFKATYLREKLSSSYFAVTDDLEDKVSMPFLAQMNNNHRKCPYWKLLKHYCPCSLDAQVKKKASKRVEFPRCSQKNLVVDHCTVKSVYYFVCAVFKRLAPLELLGNDLNLKCFLRNVQLLLSVQKYGDISLSYMVRGIRISKIPWIWSAEQYDKRELLLKCADYLIMKVICPLVESFFYFVDSSHAKIKLFVFRKRVWHRLCYGAFVDFSKFCKLNLISEETFKRYVIEQRCLGSAKLNFILKKSSLRPICNFSFRDNRKASINDHLKPLLAALNYEKETNPSNFGAMGMGKADFHKRFQEYIMKVKKGGVKKLYCVTADVEKCFDSINPTVVLDLVKKLLKADVYVVHIYRKNISGKNQFYRYFESIFRLDEVQHRYGDVEYIREYTVSKKTLVKKVESLLQCNVLKMGKQYYLQNKGIAQGSKVSSVLSAVYLGAIEAEIRPPLGLYDFLIRMEDEYLICSSMKSTAATFLENLSARMKMYECNINLDKCQASFDCVIRPYRLISKSPLINFFGLSFDPTTFCVLSDYSHYKGLKTSDVVTWKLSQNPGQYFKQSVLKSLYPKCDVILFDKNVNNKCIIQQNILRIFCMTAMKFHCLVMHLPAESRIDKNPKFFLDTILSLPLSFVQQTSHNLSKFNKLKNKNKQSPLPLSTVTNLCIKAFLYKLKQHFTVYQNLIPKIEDVEKKTLNHQTNLKSQVTKAFKDIHLR